MEVGSVTGAAERLHVTQPAVSKMLAQLERDLGFSAFARERRRLVPTPEAQILYQEVRRAFIGLDQLRRLAGDLRDMRQGRLVIAASYVASSWHLPGVVAAFLRAHPGLSVSMHALDSPTTARAVAGRAGRSGRGELRRPHLRGRDRNPLRRRCRLRRAAPSRARAQARRAGRRPAWARLRGPCPGQPAEDAAGCVAADRRDRAAHPGRYPAGQHPVQPGDARRRGFRSWTGSARRRTGIRASSSARSSRP